MSEEHQIVSQVYEAKKDPEKADAFIRQYLGFIKSETAKFIGRVPQEGRDDELSIAMLAFYETITAYDRARGAFLRLASVAIRNRLIDYARSEKRHSGCLSYDEPASGDGSSIGDTLISDRGDMDGAADRISAQGEIAEFSMRLSEYGLTLSDVADSCPRQERTLAACMTALNYARENIELISELVRTKKVPLAALAAGSGVERKTLERHRKYLVAIMLAYTNGYEYIRRHLGQMKGGTR